MHASPVEAPPNISADPAEPVGAYWKRRWRQSLHDRYAGVPCVKLPEDLRVYEHILWATRPDAVIEIGTLGGGSALWFRDRLRTLEHYDRRRAKRRPLVVSLDLDTTAAAAELATVDADFAETIVLLDANVTDPSVPDRVASLLPAGARCLVVDDSAHTYETTIASLRGFARFVSPGDFFVLEDGCVDDDEWRADPEWPRGVLPALHEWLATEEGRAFEVRRDLETYGLSTNRQGFLQRRR